MKKHLLLIISVFVSYVNLTAQICLTPTSSPYSLAQQPFALTSGDFNNDGKIDIASADRFSNSVTVLFGNGSGDFLSTNTFTLSVSGPISITNGDFNEDGNIDIAVANNSSANVTLLIGDGVGGFTPTSNFPVGSAPQSITRADFNSDGFEDLAVANNSSNNISILLGTGTGSFAAAVSYSAGAGPMSVITADFNNDSNLDLGVANYTGNNVSILLGNGAGGFGAATNFTVGSFPRSITYADFNFDSFWDIAISNDLSSGTVSVLLGNGTGSFTSSGTFPVGTNPYSISTGDFNSDGNIDLATANTNSQNVSVLPGNGAGGFGTAVNFNIGTSLSAVISTDFNSDGRTDLVSANFNSLSLFLNLLPTVTANASQTTVCLGENITLTGGGAITYSWSDGVIDGSPFTPTSTATYSVLGIDANGCSNTSSVNITVNTPMPLTISPSNPTICQTDIVNFSVSPNGTYTLVPGGMTGDLFNASPATTTTYTIESIDMNGCDNSETYTITVNPMPMLNISSNSPVCENANLSFTNSSSIASGSMTYFWEGPNGFTSTSSDPFLSPANTLMSGDYTLTATSDLGCSSIMNISATVNSLPMINAFASSSSICAGETVTLTASGGSSYIWQHNSDTNYETTDSPIGNTNYNVIGTDMNGCSNIGSTFVTVNTPSLLSFSPSSASICEGTSANFTVTPGGTYTISPGGQTGDIFSVTPSNSSSFTIDGYDMNGCYVTDIYNVTVNETPIAGGSSNNACVSGDIILFNSSSIGIGSMTYLWSGPNSFTTSAQTPTISSADLTMSGDYTLTVTSDLGCTDDAIISVTVNPLPTVNIGGPSSICSGTSATLTATGALSYTWSTTDNTSSIVITPTTSTTYTVEGEDANGCKNNAGTFISVDSPIPFSVSPSSPSICVGSSVNFTVSPTSTYTLNPGGTTGDNFNESPSVTTTYTIQGNDINGCDITNTYEIFVNPQPIAAANFNQAVICENNNLSSVNTSTIIGGSISSYAWNGPNSFSSSNADINISNATTLASGDYTLTVTSDQNCVDVAIISATVNPKPNVSATASATNICSSATATLTASGANTYTWSTSANTISIAVTPTAQTTYTVVGENAFACKDTTTILINTIFSKSIDGIATSTTGTINGEVTIYKFSPILSMWDSLTTVNFSPNFTFGQLDSGKYVLRATPSATNIQTTYGNSSINWQNATILNHGCTANSSQTITLIPFENIGTGSGTLIGTVVEGIGFGQKPSNGTSTMVPLAPGNPIGGIIVKGGKNPGGNMFTQTETDVNGTYTITGIPNTAPGESIFVFIDIPGLDTAGTYCRTFVSGESYTGLNFVVDSAKIRPVNPNQCLDVRISENSFETSLTIYPNPAKDVININFELNENANVSIELIDIIGRTTSVTESNKMYSAQKHRIQLNTKDIPNGVYLVKMKINNSVVNRKIIISK